VIEHLPLLTPNAARGARTVARCREGLARRRRALDPRLQQPRLKVPAVERTLVAGACVVYLIAAARHIAGVFNRL
jgi:hypothetical protein